MDAPEIKYLHRTQYEGYTLTFQYDSELYYDVRIRDTGSGFSVDFVRMPFPVEKKKEFEATLYEPHWDDPEAFGIFEDRALAAVVEITPEQWNGRLRITNLWVEDLHRRRGMGRALMDFVKEQALRKRCRAIVLETQTCNANAIEFYLSQGFMISGFDGYAYSNEDIERKEVRLEMLYKPSRAKGY